MKRHNFVILLSALLPSMALYADPIMTLDKAQQAVQAAVGLAKEKHAALSCAVVDARGDLVVVMRMDGARFFTTQVAEGKALTSAMLRRPSGDVGEMANTAFFPVLNKSLQGRMIPVQGAVPIISNEKTVGGIGCSGAAPELDEAAAKAGAALFI